MKTSVQTLIVGLVILANPQVIDAQQGVARSNVQAEVSVGMSVSTTREILARAEVPDGGPKPFAAHPDGDKWLFYTLKEGHADLVIRYSPRDECVTGIAVYYATNPRSRTEVAVPVSSIRFHPDGSYALLFPSSAPKRKPSTKAASRIVADAKGTPRRASQVAVDAIGSGVVLTGRLGHPLGTMLTVSGRWSFPGGRVKDYSLRFIATDVNGQKLASPVVFPVSSVSVTGENGINSIPPYARHKELEGTAWTVRAYETGRFTRVPAEYWRVRGAPAMVPEPPFASELVGFLSTAVRK